MPKYTKSCPLQTGVLTDGQTYHNYRKYNNLLSRYSIYSGSKDNFIIDPVTGVISVAPDANLDIDQNGELYELEVKRFFM